MSQLTEEEQEIMQMAKRKLQLKYQLSEDEAYRFIRSTAMDARMTKLEICKGILENN